jgi:hypothetical protein
MEVAMKPLFLTTAALLALAPVAAPGAEAPAPANPVTIQLASGTETLHPFTTHRFPVASPEQEDPVNLVFEGAADPREVRAALMSVDGDRTAFGLPSAFPFNCTWTEAAGDEQATWTAGAGWEGGAIQLACGAYAMRFHLRLFRHGARTLGGAHLDLQVPATTQHEVIAWNFPQTLVKIDLLRSGLLGSDPYTTEVFGPTPYHRAMPYYIHNALPVTLRALLELPLEDTDPAVSLTVPIPSNGKATVLDVLPSFVPAQSDTRTEFAVAFNQGIPKPFCNDGTQWVWVRGPVHFTVRVQLNPSGRYLRTQLISGQLEVTPYDPRTGQPTGPTVPAFVFENHRGMLTDNYGEMNWSLGQTISGEVTQVLSQDFRAGQHDAYTAALDCGPAAP